MWGNECREGWVGGSAGWGGWVKNAFACLSKQSEVCYIDTGNPNEVSLSMGSPLFCGKLRIFPWAIIRGNAKSWTLIGHVLPYFSIMLPWGLRALLVLDRDHYS